MAKSLHPRSRVRLRLEGASALLRRPGAASLLCAVTDLSEEGCHCRASLEDVDRETAASWRGALAAGLIVTLELSDPPELRGLVFEDAQVRWVKLLPPGDIRFGLHLTNPKPEQKHMLLEALLAFAAAKLRRASMTVSDEVEDKGPKAALPLSPSPSPEGVAGGEAAAGAGVEPNAEPKPAPQQAAHHGARRVFVAGPRGMRLSGAARQRPQRLKVSLPVVFEFCGPDGAECEEGLHQGSTVDVSEGGIMMEGPAPSFCHPTQLVGYQTCASITIRAGDHDVRGFCVLRSAVPSKHKENHWLYGMQIVEMSAPDREILYRVFAKAERGKH